MAEVPESCCPACRRKMDRATAVDGSGAMPVPGDVTVCFGCGEALTFGEGLELQLVDWSALDASTTTALLHAQETVLSFRDPS